MRKNATAVFVFGSNLAGRHGLGAALEAYRQHGAIYGLGEGLQGRSYAIPTKDERIKTLPLARIREGVDRFIAFADTPMGENFLFQVTRIGCGLAGYTDADIAPMFRGAPLHVILPLNWRDDPPSLP